MARKSRTTSIILAIVLAMLSGCVPYMGRHFHIEFVDVEGMRTIEMGRMEEDGVVQYVDIPLEYELSRDSFLMRFVATGTIWPGVTISASAAGKPLQVSLVGTPERECFDAFGDWGNENIVTFLWIGGAGCSSRMHVEIVLKSQEGVELGRETLPFQLVPDGFYYGIDAI